VTETPPSGLRRLLAGEFERRGWEWDIAEGGALVDAIGDSDRVDPQQLAQRVSGTYLQRVGADRADIADAIQNALGGRVPGVEEERPPVTLVFQNDNRHQLNMGAGAQITGSQVNVGGTQINVRVDSPKEDALGEFSEEPLTRAVTCPVERSTRVTAACCDRVPCSQTTRCPSRSRAMPFAALASGRTTETRPDATSSRLMSTRGPSSPGTGRVVK
jgi:hypothetical protein